MKHKPWLFFLLIILSPALSAQEVQIKGKALAYVGKEMTAFTYEDYITYTRETLETDTVKPDGSFSLHFPFQTTQRIYLRCDHMKAPIYIEPGGKYEVVFPDKDSSRLFNQTIDQAGDLSIQTHDTTEINWLIMDFNARYDDFWKKNYQAFVIKKTRFALDSFKRATQVHYRNIKNPYFQAYIDYSIASTQVSTLESQNFLARDYLYNKPIGYTNNEYMTFFNQFFDKYFYQFAIKKEGAPVYDAINEKGGAPGLMEALKAAKYLANDTLRELLMLKGLYENYNNKQFNQARIQAILGQVAMHSKISEHRLVAQNIISRFSQLKRGSAAPAFNLPDKNGKMHSLADFKGKYIYLTFGAAWCTTCISESKYLEELEKKYPFIQIVNIDTDPKIEDMKKMLKENPKMNWTVLYAGDNEQLKHAYNIFSVPYYYLIGPDGRLLLSPAPSPYQGIDELFYKISNKKGNKKVGEW